MLELTRSGHIEIDLLKRQLSYFQGSYASKIYPIAIGKPSTPSPVGTWNVINKKILKHSSIFGTRWMGLSATGYGIHGTNNPNSIGKAISHGCIRLYNHNVEELFSHISIGTKVIIHKKSTYNIPENNPNNNPSNNKKTYVIKAGDTLWSIANKLNIHLNELIKLNPAINPTNLQIGQIIYLP